MKREIAATRIRIRADDDTSQENVVQRLRRRIAEAGSRGIVVRTEWLDGQQPSWLELRGVRTIILDASQTAADQLDQLNEILADISRSSSPALRAA